MSWVRLDDRWWSDPAVLALSAEARDLFVRLLTFAACHYTDGALASVAMVAATAGQPLEERRGELLTELVGAGFLAETGAGWQVVDPARFLRSKEDAERDRAIRRRGGLARAEQAQRDGGRFAPHQQHQQPAGTSSTSSQLAPAGPAHTPSRPVPSRMNPLPPQSGAG
jgi:hypothetical protein